MKWVSFQYKIFRLQNPFHNEKAFEQTNINQVNVLNFFDLLNFGLFLAFLQPSIIILLQRWLLREEAPFLIRRLNIFELQTRSFYSWLDSSQMTHFFYDFNQNIFFPYICIHFLKAKSSSKMKSLNSEVWSIFYLTLSLLQLSTSYAKLGPIVTLGDFLSIVFNLYKNQPQFLESGTHFLK